MQGKEIKNTHKFSEHGKNGTWIIHGGTGKITVCSRIFYGVNSNFYYVGSIRLEIELVEIKILIN